jgi:hypothetical protein
MKHPFLEGKEIMGKSLSVHKNKSWKKRWMEKGCERFCCYLVLSTPHLGSDYVLEGGVSVPVCCFLT